MPPLFWGRASEDLVQRLENGVPLLEEDGVTPLNDEPLTFGGQSASKVANPFPWLIIVTVTGSDSAAGVPDGQLDFSDPDNSALDPTVL